MITAGRIKYITGCNGTENRTQRTETHGYAENGAEGSQSEQLGQDGGVEDLKSAAGNTEAGSKHI